MRAALATLLIFAVAGLSACRSAEQPPLRKGEPVSLRLNVPSNSPCWVEASRRSAGRYGFMGEEIRIEGFTRFVYELRSLQRSRAGDTEFSITPRIYAIDDRVVTPRGDRLRPPEMETLFNDLEQTVLLHPFTFTVNADGGISHIDGLSELENSVAAVVSRHDLQFGKLDPVQQHAWRRAFMAHIDDRPIRRHLQDTYGFLPKALVRLGDEWPAAQGTVPWPYLPTDETIRLINQQEGHWYIQTAGEFSPPPESDWAKYKGSKNGYIYADVETGLVTERQETIYWKRKRGRTPWEQFTLKTLEASESVRVQAGTLADSPPLNAINRFPMMEDIR